MYVWLVILVVLGFLTGLHSLAFGERTDHSTTKEERQKGFFDVI